MRHFMHPDTADWRQRCLSLTRPQAGNIDFIYCFIFSCHDFRCRVVLAPSTHADNERGEHDPAHLPPYTGLVANHLLDVVVELVHTCETNESMIKIFISNLFQFAAGLPRMLMSTVRWNTRVLLTLRLNGV